MRALSKKRQAELGHDKRAVELLYEAACIRFGKDKVDKDLTKIWDLRCMQGMMNILPFDSTNFSNIGEMLYVAQEICGLPPKAEKGKKSK